MKELANVLRGKVECCSGFEQWKRDWTSLYKQELQDKSIYSVNFSLQQAFYDGCRSDRMAWAFSGGYQWAIRSLVPAFLKTNAVLALCITEERGGHPRSIHTRLSESEDGFTITGRKQFVSGGTEADILLVAAKTGREIDGRPELKMLSLPSTAEGVGLEEMSPLSIMPEVPHAVVTFDNVLLNEQSVLPGDGYADYIRQFRLQEDLHVQNAVLGLIVRKAYQFGAPELLEQALGLSSALEGCRVRGESSVTGLAMTGIEAFLQPLLEQVVAISPEAEKKILIRDKELLNIAGKARAVRLRKAREWLGF